MREADKNKRTSLQFLRDLIRPLALQEVRRIYDALGHIVTTGLATSVVIGLFLYIFGDFIGGKLPDINSEFAAKAQAAFIGIILMVVSIIVFKWCKQILFSDHGWLAFFKSLGQSEAHLQHQATIATILSLIVSIFISALFISKFLGPISWIHGVIVALTIVVQFKFLHKQSLTESRDQKDSPHSIQDSRDLPLIAWRKSRLMMGRWPGAPLRWIAAGPIILGTLSIVFKMPPVLAPLCCLLGGVLLSWTVPFLVAEDLNATWMERQAAVHHEQWIGAWQSIFWGWSKRIAAVTFTLVMVSSVYVHIQSSSWSSDDLIQILKQALTCALLGGFPIWLAPAFVMQIDGRKTLTNILMLTLIGLFSGTAIMAVPILAPALYFMHREAHRYQGGRFARGSNH